MRAAGNFVYAVDSGGVSIVDATDPTHLRPRRRLEISGAADLQVVDDLVYVAAGDNGLLILRVHPERFPPAVFLPMLRQKS